MFNSKLLGGILLIVGTSIGGGMLALPVATAEAGLASSILSMIMCWLIMTAGALLILEVNLRLPAGSNMVSMAKATLGLPGQVIAWIAYLFLLYALLSAYISGGSDVLNALLHQAYIDVPLWLTTLLFTLLFGWIVYKGIHIVDYVNRGLMFGKLGVYIVLLAVISPHIQLPDMHQGTSRAIMGSLMVLITSFGFASIVPSLRDYFKDDIRSLRLVIWLGSLIPLCCYILWNLVIMGALQQDGRADVLMSIAQSEHAASGLNAALNQVVQNHFISGFFGFFSSICMITAFLGVSLGLFDFLADGLKLQKVGCQGNLILSLTFLPPLLIVLVSPGIYLHALAYAGMCCVVLLLLLPSVMAYKGRKQGHPESLVMVRGGNAVLLILILTSIGLLYLAAPFFS